jgi:hypothetical protein
MSARKTFSEKIHQNAKGLVGDLVRMWQAAPARGRLDACEQAGRTLGISGRKAKAVIYDEETLSLFQAGIVGTKEQSAWLHLADEFLQLAEYCKSRAELARIKRTQQEIDFTKQEAQCCISSTTYPKRAA